MTQSTRLPAPAAPGLPAAPAVPAPAARPGHPTAPATQAPAAGHAPSTTPATQAPAASHATATRPALSATPAARAGDLSAPSVGPVSGYVAPVLDWYEVNQRDLPWRRPGTSAWSILVSEIMLQQTPVARVLPAHAAWLERWPTPAALAAATAGDAVRQWGRLGYPRRAVRLHAIAQALVTRHGGVVPASAEVLLTLPGIGPYTAAAVASFAFGQRHAVLDTNVRRVLARLVAGVALPPPTTSAAERRLAESLLPRDDATSARWAVAVMELGALVCTAARPDCAACPVAAACAWRRAGAPPAAIRRAAQTYAGSDRQCRGALLAVLRAADGPVPAAELNGAWHDSGQRARALAALIADGLVVESGGYLALPGEAAGPGGASPS
jgi:A/G-specific adenine glycosylase